MNMTDYEEHVPDVPAACARTTTSSRATWSSTGRRSIPASSRWSRSTRAARAAARSASAIWRALRGSVANALEGLGVNAGERAFVMLPRIPEWYELLLGMFRRGVVPMPATTLCTARDIAQRIERAQATLAVVDDEAAAKLADGARPVPVAAPRDRRSARRPRPATSATPTCSRAPATPSRRARVTRADDPLLLYFTSGTVAAPKMVLHTHASMGAGHEITARFWQDLTPADLHWTFSDTGWAKAAWGKLFGQWRMGAAVFLWDQRGKLDPELCLRVLERSGVTTFCAPPTLFRAFVQLDLGAFDLARVRHTRLGRRAAQPGGHPRLARGHRHDDLRRLRADRDRQPRRQLPLPRGAPGLDGQADAGQRRRRRLGRRRAPRRPARRATSRSRPSPSGRSG